MIKILTRRENEIIGKKLHGQRLTQNESNILSKSVRPKLWAMREVNAEALLRRLEYNQRARSIENRIKKLVIGSVNSVCAIILYGSVVQTNYQGYNDIDVLIVTKRKKWASQGDKHRQIVAMANLAKSQRLNLDIQMVDKKSLSEQYPSNPSLIYQLKDCKIIYGTLKIPSKMALSKLDLRMKLDWSDIDDEESDGSEIYQSLRNILLVQLLVKKIVSNESLRESLDKSLGAHLIEKLRNNTASVSEKKLILQYIKELSDRTDKEIRGASWEKIVL